MILRAAAMVLVASLAFAQNADPFAALHFRYLGPMGNRTSAVVGEPGNPRVMYVGAASGGIFKTTDGGHDFKPVFDHEDVAAIGALAIAASAHNIVWAGTGEPWLIRPDHSMGNGVYKSTDSGATWQHAGLEETGHIARIVIDPRDPDRVFACAVGQAYRPQRERGVFRTLDGGKTWQQVLFVNENTGCSELAMDAHDPDTLFAGTWQIDIKPWNENSGGPGSGVYVSHDGGTTWARISGHGLPAASQPIGKVAVAVAPSDSRRVYALMEEAPTARLYRSDDGGQNWRMMNQEHVLDQRGPYFTRIVVSPTDADTFYIPSVEFSMSRDGGATIFQPGFPANLPGLTPVGAGYASPGTDNHDVWVDPLNPKRIMVSHDDGFSVSLDGAHEFQVYALPNGQMYHVHTDNQVPYFVYTNRQDGAGVRAPSNTLMAGGFEGGGGIQPSDWMAAGGGESGWQIPDPTDPNIIWGTGYDGEVSRMDLRTGQVRAVPPWPVSTMGWAPADVKYRWHWTQPLAISPHDHNRVYVGSQVVHVTEDGGQTWKVISPDLTTNDKSHQQRSGGVGSEQLGQFSGATLYSIAESPVKAGILWTGSNDGVVSVSPDGGAHWTNVSKNIPNLPPWGTIFNIEPSHFDANTAYITVNRQQLGDYNAYVFESTDLGRTWRLLSAGIPKSVNSSAHCVIEHPTRRGMLYLGTDNAIYVSWDDGGHWTRLRSNLPPAPVYWLTIQPHFHDLVVATYGRGIYILDDVTPLRDWDRVQQNAATFFQPRPAYRFRRPGNSRMSDSPEYEAGENPPYGADLNYVPAERSRCR